MPLSLHGPQSVREEVSVQLPQAWPDRKLDRTVANDAFRLSKSLRVHDRTLTADYLLEIPKEQVDASSVATLASDIGQARHLLGDSVSTATAHNGGAGDWAVWLLLCLGVFGALQLWVVSAWLIRRLRARTSRSALPDLPTIPGPAAANDSEQPLAA